MSKNGRDVHEYELEGPNENDYDDRDHFIDDDPLDAFNEETFAGGLDGNGEDWEAEHDQMILLEHQGKVDPEIPLLTDKFNNNLNIANNELNKKSSITTTNSADNNISKLINQENITSSNLNNNFQNLLSKIKLNPIGQVSSSQVVSPPTTLSGKVKTLEELEQELLGKNDKRRSPPNIQAPIQPPNRRTSPQQQQQQQQNAATSSFPPNLPINPTQIQQHQQQQLELLKLLPYLSAMQQQQQQPSQMNNEDIKQPTLTQEQKLLLLQQQQQLMEQMNINRVLTSNSITIQQRQFIVAQLQKNLQTTYLQLQLLQQRQQFVLGDEQQLQLYQTLQKQLQQQQQQIQLQLQQQQQLLLQQHIVTQQAQLQQQLQKQQQQVQAQFSQQSSLNNLTQQQQQLQQQQDISNVSQSKSDTFDDHHSENTSIITTNNERNNYNNNRNRTNNKNRRKRFTSQNEGGDKLAGMMTDKEKNWVINVQMLQLHVDDSYRQDYYYTALMKKKEKFSSSDSNMVKPQVSNLINKHDPKTYKPKTFENSLGKLTTSNFHHPRALIELTKRTHENDDKTKESKNICTILLEIERMYQLYLEIDEIEHNILRAPEEHRVNLFQDRRAKVDKLLSTLCNENFAHYLFVAKGKRLLGKCLPSFNTTQTKLILALIMQYIYVISKNNITLDDIYHQISTAIDTQKFTDLVEIVHTFVHLYSNQPFQIYNTILLNKFGLTYLLKFISKSELVTQDDYEIEIKNIWSIFLNLILNAMFTLSNTTILNSNSNNNVKMSSNETYYLNVNCILDEFQVNRQLWLANESKLGELFNLVYN